MTDFVLNTRPIISLTDMLATVELPDLRNAMPVVAAVYAIALPVAIALAF
ncbi:MAG: hypothetical protein AAF415_02915 [Pseudomonadota bacterium]